MIKYIQRQMINDQPLQQNFLHKVMPSFSFNLPPTSHSALLLFIAPRTFSGFRLSVFKRGFEKLSSLWLIFLHLDCCIRLISSIIPKTCFRSCDRLLNISLLLVLKVFENMVGMQVKQSQANSYSFSCQIALHVNMYIQTKFALMMDMVLQKLSYRKCQSTYRLIGEINVQMPIFFKNYNRYRIVYLVFMMSQNFKCLIYKNNLCFNFLSYLKLRFIQKLNKKQRQLNVREGNLKQYEKGQYILFKNLSYFHIILFCVLNYMEKSLPFQKQLRQQVDDLIREIDCQPNVFLQRELKDFMIQLTKDPELKTKKYFPTWFQERISTLKLKLTDNHMTTPDILKELHQKFTNMELRQPSPNEAANVLLDTVLSKSLSLNLSKKLIKLIETEKQDEKILAFIKQRYEAGTNQRQFIKEIKDKRLKNRKVPDLNTLISQIIKMRPKQVSVLERLFKHRENCKIFQQQLIEVSSQKMDSPVNGKITKASYNQNIYRFEVVRFQECLKIQIHLTNEAIQKVVVRQQKFQPLKKIVNQLLSKLNVEKAGKSIIFGIFSICHNRNFYSNSTILPEADYKFNFEFGQSKCKLTFIAQTQAMPQYIFDIYWKDNQIQRLKYLKSNQYHTVDQFFNCYLVKLSLNKLFTFSNKQNISRCIKIYKPQTEDNKQTLEKLQRFQRRKEQLIGKFLSFEKQRFNQSLQVLIDQNAFSSDWLKRLQIQDEVQHILQLARQLGDHISVQSLMSELLNKVNYTNLVNKDQTLNTIKAVQLFTQSQAFTSTIKGKDIITFYGNTGSGKSTSVNYLIGVPLESANNRFGDRIVRIVTEESQSKKTAEQYSKIGQSNGFSQTLFTKGYNILPDEQMQDKQLYDNIVLCDNPGFRDTRGTQYEICTNLSMDRAIEVCKSIKAIVLIVPYQAITLDKGIPLLQLMYEIQSRFPNILNRQSDVSKKIYLLVTKRVNKEINLDSISQRFVQILSQHTQHYGSHINNYNTLQRTLLSQKIKIYQALNYMCKNQQIDIIDINNKYERQQLLRKYIQNPIKISQKYYKKTLTDNNLMIKFLNQISTSAHSWSKLILEPYTKSIVSEIQQLQTNAAAKKAQVKQIQNSTISAQKAIVQKTEYLTTLQMVAAEIRGKLEQIHDSSTEKISQLLEQSQINEPNDKIEETPQFVQDYQERIQNCKEYIAQLQKEIISQKQRQNLIVRKKQLCSQQTIGFSSMLQELKKEIQGWKKGEIDQQIFKSQCKLGEIIYFGSESYTKEQRLQLVDKGQELPKSKNIGKFKCGQLNKRLCNIIKISKDYALMPNRQFDPNQYITKSCSVFGRYKAIIECNKTTLQAVKLFQEGKVLFISYLEQFVVTKNQKELPLLKIIHKIPNEEHNSDLIRNADAQIRMKSKQISTNQELMEKLNSQIDFIDLEIRGRKQSQQELRNRILQLQKQNAEARQNEINLKRAKLEQQKKILLQKSYRNQLENNQGSKRNNQQQIKRKKQERQNNKNKKLKCQDEIIKLELKCQQTKFKHKRFALLIRNQLSKKIPQTLANFIEIAKSMIKQVAQQKKISKEADMNSKLTNLNFFLEQYGKIKDTIEQQVSKHLSEK